MQHSKRNRWKLTAEQKALKKLGWKFYPPRKWKQGQKNHWLRTLRIAIGKSQAQFAAMIGEQCKTIINIENGRTRLDGNLAHKIQASTGVSSWLYMQGKNTPMDFAGQTPYVRAHFDDWKQAHSGNYGNIAKFVDLASDTLTLMLQAAKKCGTPKNHLPALKMAFHFWCLESVKNFQLKDSLDEILKSQRKYLKERTMSYGDWRRPEMDGYREFYQFKDDTRKLDSELLTLRVQAHAGWSVCGNMKVPKGGIESEHFKIM